MEYYVVKKIKAALTKFKGNYFQGILLTEKSKKKAKCYWYIF